MSAPHRTTPPNAIARQIVLPWSKSLSMAVNSLRVRFFRSVVTALSLVLAIAFLAFTLTNTAIAHELFRLQPDAALPLLLEAGYRFDPQTGVHAGPRDLWLMVLSLLVCTVGIVNAQLMAVTERFREIGIMKCLGALDRFIVRQFLLEAVIVGTAGAGAGALLGALGAGISSWATFTGMHFASMDLLPLLTQTGLAWSTGVVLSVLGVLYPALLAAKLQPVIVMKEEY